MEVHIMRCLAVAALLLATPACAQERANPQDVRACESNADPRSVVRACTGVIQARNTEVDIHLRALVRRSEAHGMLGDMGGAVRDANTALMLNPQSAGALHARGYAHMKSGNLEQAEADLNASISLDPSIARAFMSRGELWRRMHADERALEDFARAIELDPEQSMGYFLRGELYQSLSDSDKAMADYNEAIRLDPMNAPALANRASIFASRGQTELSLADYDRAAEAQPNNHYFQGFRCTRRIELNLELNVAKEACDAAIRLNPGSLRYMESRALISLVNGHDRDALADYTLVASGSAGNDSQLARALFGKAVAALRLGGTETAQADLSRARQLDDGVDAYFERYGIRPPT